MAALALRLVVVAVLAAAAADDVPVEWSGGRTLLSCVVPEAERFAPRPPPPPLAADDSYRPFAWTHEGQPISVQRVAVNGSLEVSRGRDGQGHYQCTANHRGGRVLGYPRLLKFASIGDEFSMSPEDATVPAGLPTVFRCGIASDPPAEIGWLKDRSPVLDDDRRYKIDNQLLILGVTKEDAGHYSCTARNPVLAEERRSSSARLTVSPAPAAGGLEPAPLPLAVDGAPAVLRGGRVVLPCPVLASPVEMKWVFTPPGGPTAELEPTGPVLVMHNVGPEDLGVYTCMVAGREHVIRQFNLTVLEPPTVVLPPVSKEAPRASTVRFNCTATGWPQPSITWYKDGQRLEYTVRARVIKSYDEVKGSGDRMELVISGITSDDAGIYQCFASNAAGIASSWAALEVSVCSAAPPANVSCRPAGPRAVAVRWSQPDHGTVVAYTVHVTPQMLDGQPILSTNATVKVAEPFTKYGFQVRAFVKNNARSGASDYSDTVYCSGQGAPVHLSKLPNSRVLVSWPQAAATPGVLEWQLQLRRESQPSSERRITLPAGTHNYTLDVSSGHYGVRVLGTKSLPWLRQDLALLPWSSTAQAREHYHGDYMTPSELVASNVTTSSFTVTWRCDDADVTFSVCLKRNAPGEQYTCHERSQSVFTAEDLDGDAQYSVKVQAHSGSVTGPFTAPLVVRTLKPEPSMFASVRPVYVNGTTALLRWGGPSTAQYTVRLLSELSLPMEVWRAQVVTGPEVYIPLNPVNNTYVMVSTTSEEQPVNSKVFTVYSQDSDQLAQELLTTQDNVAESAPTDVQDIRHEYASDGLTVRWRGPPAARYRVRFSQDLLTEMEAWRSEYVNKPQILLKGLDPSLPTHLQVRLVRPEVPGQREAPVHTLPPAPSQHSSLYLGVGVGVGVCLLCLLLLTAFCVWQRRKRHQSPSRAGRRNLSSQESNEEECSEMTTVGGRLANGGSRRGADEPLLNGHVHITENPTVTKSPNGKTKKRGFDVAAFDVSRFEEADTTAETTLEADISAPYEYLDTSRQPDSSRTHVLNPEFDKLPDDNMNSEVTRSTDYIQKDNSKVQPTLQPNG